MKKFSLKAVLFLMFGLFCFVSSACAREAAWDKLSQDSKAQKIVSKTFKYNTRHFKEVDSFGWARVVVLEASGGKVRLPDVGAEGDSFLPSPSLAERKDAIENTHRGEIIQMKLSTGRQHTAIVVEVSQEGVLLIECDWDHKTKPNTVHTRYVPRGTFYEEVQSFTVYRML